MSPVLMPSAPIMSMPGVRSPTLPTSPRSPRSFTTGPDDEDDNLEHNTPAEASSDLPRAASYTHLPTISDDGSPERDFKRVFSETVLAVRPEEVDGKRRAIHEDDVATKKDILRRTSMRSKTRSTAPMEVTANGQSTSSSVKIEETVDSNGNEAPATEELHQQTMEEATKPEVVEKPLDTRESRPRPVSRKSMSGKLANLARRSWIARSRTPSPTRGAKEMKEQKDKDNGQKEKKRAQKDIEKKEQASRSSSRSTSPVKMARSRSFKTFRAATKEPEPPLPVNGEVPLARKGTVLKKAKRPLSAFIPSTKSSEKVALTKSPSLSSLRSKISLEKLVPSTVEKEAEVIMTSDASSPKVPPMPNFASVSAERTFQVAESTFKKKDELWTAFRSLDAEYQKFQSKSSAFKANVVRQSLIPFINRYATHPSSRTLRPEDLDRRTNILNRWWTALLEMLNGQNNQSVSGTDRPVYLEAVTGIMRRPEWRIPSLIPTSHSPGASSLMKKPGLNSRSTTSLESTGSDFLLESIYHNVRNTFIQNLLSQMTFVVEKLSMRSAPASLVSFCGKACAYAFFFCPGVADLLVRLWQIPPDNLRRVLAEFDIHRGTDMKLASREISTMFPPATRGLLFDSHASLVRTLRRRAPPPLGTSYLNWFGPWTNRWCGRDSDLFFVFTKHFHILVADFLAPDIEKKNRAMVPGLVCVHAQMLNILDNTLCKPAGAQHDHFYGSSVSFDDFVDGADTSASALPLGAANVVRSMAENRHIMLLRDILADNSEQNQAAKQLYAESFADVLKAAARKTSLFDHNACFVLCDFMEEVMRIMHRFHSDSTGADTLDWPFWLLVCKQMMESHNSLTEVRLFAFIYSTWNIITTRQDQKQDLCLGWLLQEDFFLKQFNHWCPMVRTYYHRLLCWRVARFDGNATDLDLEIFTTLMNRLRTNWSYYLFIQDEAEKQHHAPLSTAPDNPAPGRRMIILRNDSQPVPTTTFISYDKVVPRNSESQATAYQSHGSFTDLDKRLTALQEQPQPKPGMLKRRWSILRPFSGASNNSTPSKPGEVTPPGSSSSPAESPEAKREAADSLDLAGANQVNGIHTNSSKESIATAAALARTNPTSHTHQAFSFKFSLEWLDRPSWTAKNKRLFLPRLPTPAQMLLQNKVSYTIDVKPLAPPAKTVEGGGDEVRTVLKYSGRALAEWAATVSECANFFDRRVEEGVPVNRLVETPTLGVESFRKS